MLPRRHLADSRRTNLVPNGGYVASVLLSAVRAHFAGPLSHLDQPDTMSLQLQFLRRTQSGPGTITIEHLKLGSTLSVVQVILTQDSRREIQGMVVQTNFSKQTGISITTSYLDSFLSPESPAPIDFAQVEKTGEDTNWRLSREMPHASFRRATQHILLHHPKNRPDPGVVDQWVRFRPGGPDSPLAPFPQESLGFVVDMFPLLIEQFPQVESGQTRWYPTVSLNLDVKRRLPAAGAEWLFVRVRAAEIKDGRMDLRVVVLDVEGRVVALSEHIALILGAERNLASRRPVEGRSAEDGTDGKL